MDDETIQRRRWGILAVLVVCLLVVILDNTILNVALRTIQQDLDASQSQMQWAVDSYILVFAGLLITWGVLGDRLGRKKVLLFGMVAFGATSALCSFAQNSTQLIVFRALMGIGAAAVQPQTLSIIQNVFEPQERAKAIGIWAGSSGLGIAIGPITGGALLKYFWWGSIFLVNVPIVIIGVIAIAIMVPESRNPHPSKLDPAGVLLSIVALVLLVYGIIEGGNSNDWLTVNALGAIVLGVALLTLFVVLQKRSSHPTIDVSLFRNRAFAAGSGVLAITFFALMGATFYLAYFLQAVRDYTPLAAGVALIAVAGAVVVVSPFAAKLSERFGPNRVAASGMLLFGLAMCGYALVGQHTAQWRIEIVMVCFGSGMGLVIGPSTNAVMGAVPREKAGAGSSVNNTIRQTAGALGVAILGSILAVGYRGHLGQSAASDLAARLDQPSAVVSQLPASQRVTPLVAKDTTESIGASFEFVAKAGTALAGRAPAAGTTAAQISAQRAAAQREIAAYVQASQNSFVSAMHLTSLVAGAIALLGAVVAFCFLPSRRRRAQVVDQARARTDGVGADPVEVA